MTSSTSVLLDRILRLVGVTPRHLLCVVRFFLFLADVVPPGADQSQSNAESNAAEGNIKCAPRHTSLLWPAPGSHVKSTALRSTRQNPNKRNPVAPTSPNPPIVDLPAA